MQTAILKAYFGDGVFTGQKSAECQATLSNAGYTRSAGAILTR